ncbi:MAG: rhodanese-like domain-containing protein [Nanoarchaeota archaeon]
MKLITVEELKELIDSNSEEFQLIDVRENYESEICNIGGENIPLGQILSRCDDISKTKKVIFYCKNGERSYSIVSFLGNQLGLKNLYSLTGGVVSWINKIDPSMSLE